MQRYPSYQKTINEFFKALGETGEPTDSNISKLETLFDDKRKNLLNQLMIQVFKDKFIEWENREDIPTDVRKQIQEWLRIIRK